MSLPAPKARRSPSLVPSPDSPLVSVRLLFHVGSVDDPPGKEGLAALTGALLAEGGSRGLTYKELLDSLYPMAASIDVHVDKDVTVLSGTVHRDNLDGYYDLLRQVVLTPRFDPTDFHRLQVDHVHHLENVLRAADDENLGKEALATMLYEEHPYGRPTIGTVQGIRSIRLDDVKSFHAARFTRDQLDLGIAGGYPAGFVERVQADLDELPSCPLPTESSFRLRSRPGIEVLLVTKPARAWAISIGFPIDVTRADDDYYPLLLANSYLGEHRTFHGVLMGKMRSDRGFNYGDYSYIESFLQEGGSPFPLPNIPRRTQFFSIWIRPIEARYAHFAIRQSLREVERLQREGMTAASFAATREFLLHYSRLWTQTASRRLGYEMDGRFYGRASLVDELEKRLPRMTVEQVNAAARRHLRWRDASVAVVADPEGAASFAEALRTDAPSPVSYDTGTRPEVLAEDREISAWPLEVSRVRMVRAEELFER